MAVYLITDPSNPDWDQLVEMTSAQAGRVMSETDFEVAQFSPDAVVSFEAFAAEYLDED